MLPPACKGAPAGDEDDTGGTGDHESCLWDGDNRDVDILFVVDNTATMARKQAVLTSSLGALVEVLERDMVEADYRIGITTTDNGNPLCPETTPENGALRAQSCRARLDEFVFDGTDPPIDARDQACNDLCDHDTIEILPTATTDDPEPRPRPWIERIEGVSNIGGELSTLDALRCLLPQGIDGCGFESQLESMYRALERTEDENDPSFGFFREGVVLAIVFITDEADCSYYDVHESVFDPDGDKVFWSDPEAALPTSALCWNAGVTCTGGPGTYDECHSEDKHYASGEATDQPLYAVMRPVDRYVDFLRDIEGELHMTAPVGEVLVVVFAGVPEGHGDGEPIVYEDGDDPDFLAEHGIGPGCESTVGRAVPPVRVREVATPFQFHDANNLHSACADDHSAALGALGDAIAYRLPAGCVYMCVADADPSTDVLDAGCEVTEAFPTADGETQRSVLPCTVETDTWDFPSAEDNVCYRALVDQDGSTPSTLDDMSPPCIDQGWNLQIHVERRPGFPAAEGTVVRIRCTPSQNKEEDCPML